MINRLSGKRLGGDGKMKYYKSAKSFGELAERFKTACDKRLKNQKGGEGKIDIKSRYEVISELEEKKRKLIVERDNFPDIIKAKKRSIRNAERELEDDKEELKDYEKSVEDRKNTIKELITSIDKSLERFSKLDTKKS